MGFVVKLFCFFNFNGVNRSQILTGNCKDGIDVFFLEVILRNIHLVLSLNILLLQLLMSFLMLQKLDHFHEIPEECARMIESVSLFGKLRLFLFHLLLLGLVGLRL